MQTTHSKERESALMPVRGPDCQSFLLDPSFLNSFLPLEKKLLFFLPCEEQSVCVRRGEGDKEQTSGLAPGSGSVSASNVGISTLASGSVCLFDSTCEGKVSSRAGNPRSWSSEEDVWVTIGKKVQLTLDVNIE